MATSFRSRALLPALLTAVLAARPAPALAFEPEGPPHRAAILPRTGAVLVFANASSLDLHRLRDGKWLRRFHLDRDGPRQTTTFAVSPDERLLVVLDATGLGAWEVATGKQKWHWPGQGSLSPGAFSRDGRFLVFSAGRRATIVEAATGLERAHFDGRANGLEGPITDAVLSPDGSQAALCTAQGLYLFDVPGQQDDALGLKVTRAFYSADGRYLATCDGARAPVFRIVHLATRKDWTVPSLGNARDVRADEDGTFRVLVATSQPPFRQEVASYDPRARAVVGWQRFGRGRWLGDLGGWCDRAMVGVDTGPDYFSRIIDLRTGQRRYTLGQRAEGLPAEAELAFRMRGSRGRPSSALMEGLEDALPCVACFGVPAVLVGLLVFWANRVRNERAPEPARPPPAPPS